MTTFTKQVQAVVRAIPKGEVLTYKQVASRAGSPNAFRAVGTILKQNFDTSIPCHRVIRSNGSLGEYNRGANLKATLLHNEGYYHNDTLKKTKRSRKN